MIIRDEEICRLKQGYGNSMIQVEGEVKTRTEEIYKKDNEICQLKVSVYTASVTKFYFYDFHLLYFLSNEILVSIRLFDFLEIFVILTDRVQHNNRCLQHVEGTGEGRCVRTKRSANRS